MKRSTFQGTISAAEDCKNEMRIRRAEMRRIRERLISAIRRARKNKSFAPGATQMVVAVIDGALYATDDIQELRKARRYLPQSRGYIPWMIYTQVTRRQKKKTSVYHRMDTGISS